MNLFVLDTSVAVKWYLPDSDEELVAEAVALFRRFMDGQIMLCVPDLFWCEATHVFAKAIRRQRMTAEHARKSFESLMKLDLETIESRSLAAEALRIANSYNRSGYDAIYVALAEATHASLITADKRLADAMSPGFPVRWLGAEAV